MRKIIFLASWLLLGGCSVQATVTEVQSTEEKDFRLYQLPMRGNVLPGIALEERKKAAELCGVKILEEGSDLIRNDEEKKKQQQLYNYASDYNKQVYAECLKAVEE